MRAAPRLLVLTTALVVCVAAVSACAPDTARQTSVTRVSPADASSTISPLERGAYRREALEVARAAVAAFLADDQARIVALWPKDYASRWEQERRDDSRKGIEHERRHKLDRIDVTDMNADGTQVIVEYYFTDLSRDVDSEGHVVGTARDEPSMVQMTLVRDARGWHVIRVIGGADSLR